MITTKDSLNAYMLRQMTKDSVVINHSAGNEDIYKANYLNALMKLKTDYKLISVGSPIAESELRESTNAVGAELVEQVNHPYDPVRVAKGVGEALEYGMYLIPIPGAGILLSKVAVSTLRPNLGKVLSHIFISTGIAGDGFAVYKGFDSLHPFKDYYENFKIKQIIENGLQRQKEPTNLNQEIKSVVINEN